MKHFGNLRVVRARTQWICMATVLAGLLLQFSTFGARPPAKPEAAATATAREALAILRDNCVGCHGEGKTKGGLAVTSREALLKGGDEGPAVTEGKPEASPLLRMLEPGADPHMPPKKQLDPAQIKTLRDWVKAGLAWDAAALDPDAAELSPVDLAPLPEGYRPAFAVALSPDARRLAIARGDTLVVHDLAATNQPVLHSVSTERDAIHSLAWSADGRLLAGGSFRRVMVWEAEGLSVRAEITNAIVDRVTALKFSPDSRWLAWADGVNARSGVLRLYDVGAGAIAAAWRAHQDTVFDLEFSRDGTRLVTAGGDKLVKVWDVAARKVLAVLEGHTSQVLAAAFNTNASQVVSGGADKQLKVWDIATKERLITLGSHSSAITAVAWPGDSSAVFAVTDSGGAWRYSNLKPHTGEQSSATAYETRLGESGDALLCVAASPDGRTVCAGDHAGVVRVWNAEAKLLATLKPATNATALAATAERTLNIRLPAPKSAGASKPSAKAPPKPALPAFLKSTKVVALTAEPASLTLTPDAPAHRVVLTARTADGFEVDVTALAKYSTPWRSPFAVDREGRVSAVKTGEAVMKVRVAGRKLTVPVRVQAAGGGGGELVAGKALPVAPPSFVRDVLPALNRTGCAAGPCHAKADGQNGFKLSVFSYDPRADYAEIVKDVHGRRVFPSAPDQSLILRKALGLVPHEGGQRFEAGSPTHRLVTRWLREGLPFAATNEPALKGISVFPRERRYHKGGNQQLLVRAEYTDGSVRDVTGLAAFDSNEKEIAKVDEDGRVTVGTLTGQGVIVARYMGFVAASSVLVPADRLLPEAQYAALPRNNFIDDLAYAQFQRLGLYPSELCTDAEFIRRASLDTVGVLPEPEDVRYFLELCGPDGANSTAARLRLIDRLLDRPDFADYWANKWADLLRPNPDRVGVKSIFVLDQWLREVFRENRPYDQFVRDILTAEGANHRDGPAVVYRDRREPPELTTMFSQLFLGTRLECAKCHHHPNEKWGQEDFYQLAAFFGPVKQKGAGLSPPISAGFETFYFAPGGSVRHPVSGEVMHPRAPDGPALKLEETADPRRSLADWLVTPDNPFFARAAVNRVWANFFGRGLVEPVDDFRISNPCVNPALLDAVARDFAANGYDFKQLIRTLLASRLYQLSATPNDSNLADTKNFSRAYRRRLPAEVVVDAVSAATGVGETFVATPVGSRAMQTWSYKIESHFLDAFGRPNSSSDCPCERDRQMSVVQTLHLMNSKALQAKLSSPEGRVHKLADSPRSPDEIVTELYLAALSRPPTAEELKLGTAGFDAPKATRQTATEDVLWALLNSPEFLLNH